MQFALDRFLNKNSIPTTEKMPVVHTTRAYFGKRIIQEGIIQPRPCHVFNGESLTYLFYGRPSYKMYGQSEISKYWELPCVFIFDYDIVNIKRMFPFDSGAFNEKRYPHFIEMMNVEEFEVKSHIDGPQRLVGSFFVNPTRYFKLQPRDKRDFLSRFEVENTDEEIHALSDLMMSYSEKFDDRRFAIEIQTSKEIILKKSGLIAVILPEEYFENDDLINQIYENGGEAIPYPTFPLKQEMYYHSIYNIIYSLYKNKGWIR